MKMLLAVLFCLFTTTVFADDYVKFKDGAIAKVTKVSPEFKYPPEVYNMTQEEFARWATEQNQIAHDESYREYVHGSEYIPADVTDTEYRGQFGYGYGGYVVTKGGTRVITKQYRRNYRNPDYQAPKPLLIINPFCPPRSN